MGDYFVLGRALQVFDDRAILRGADPRGVLPGTKPATPTAGLSLPGGGKECRQF
jgi:hypothetical protein